MLFASSLDNVWNDLPVHPVFVPFVAETARYLSDVEEGAAQAIGRLGARAAPPPQRRHRRCRPSTRKASAPCRSASRFREQMLPLTQVGFYELRRAGATELVAVNPDPRESNLRPMEPDTLAMWKATGREHEAPSKPSPDDPALKPPPIRIWRLLLVAGGLGRADRISIRELAPQSSAGGLAA